MKKINWRPFFSYPVHVEGEKDLVHIAAGLLCHAVHLEHRLELKEGYEPRRRLLHELGVPVVHVLLQDVVQAGAVGAHGSCTGASSGVLREVSEHS